MPLLEKPTDDQYILAAQIRGKLKPENLPMSDAGPMPRYRLRPRRRRPMKSRRRGGAETKADRQAEPTRPPIRPRTGRRPTRKKSEAEAVKADPEINVILVSDIDCLYGAFFALRARGEDPDEEFEFHFDNVPFVLNVLDVLADDKRFVDIRTRRPSHRTLTKINEVTESARKEADKAREKYCEGLRHGPGQGAKGIRRPDGRVVQAAGRQPPAGRHRQAASPNAGTAKLDVALQGLKDKRDKSMKASQTNLELAVRKVQDNYKLWAVLLPPIPPLIVALIVFFNRRASEREGVSKARLR